MSSATRFEYFAACAPGLEPLLADELGRLGLDRALTRGGVTGKTDTTGLWRLHLGSALAESVRVRLKSFTAHSFAELEAGLARLPWHAFLWRGQPVEVRVTCHKSKLYHSDAVAERVERVIGERLAHGKPARSPVPKARVYLRLARDVVTPSIDSSGERLHQRGYRLFVEDAPLRETLAAAMVQCLERLATEEQSVTRVWDPFCGSGVLPLEWLRHSLDVWPGEARAFAFESWPTHDRASWIRFREEVPHRSQLTEAHAFASDIDEKAIASARSNAERTGLLPHLTLFASDFQQAVESIPPGTAVLGNPPYGKRLGSPAKARALYASLARLLSARRDLRPVLLACPDRSFLPANQTWQVLAKTRTGGFPLSFVGLAG